MAALPIRPFNKTTNLLYRTLLIFSLLGLLACTPDTEAAAKLQATLNDQIEVAYDVETVYSDSAQIRVIINAPRMEKILDPKDERQRFPIGIAVHFLDVAGDTSSILTAKQGVYRERKNQVILSDSVVWKSAEGQKLETDELTWDEPDERIHTDRFVVITQPDYIIYGYGLEAKQDFSDARVNQITGRVPMDRPRE